MICERFVHIGIGDTGEGIVRHIVAERFYNNHLLAFSSTAAHGRFLDVPVDLRDRAFTFVRNPFSWYVSRWIHALMNWQYRGSFRDHVLLAPCGERSRRFGWGKGMGGSFTDAFVWHTHGEIPDERIGRYESFSTDFVRILAPLVDGLYTRDQIVSWFPDAFGAWKAWSAKPWLLDIETPMRLELYADNRVRDYVERHDGDLMRRFGYSFDYIDCADARAYDQPLYAAQTPAPVIDSEPVVKATAETVPGAMMFPIQIPDAVPAELSGTESVQTPEVKP